jgi:hypothetical protein
MAAGAAANTTAQTAITSQIVGVRGKSTSKPNSDTADTRNPIHGMTETSFLS